MKHLKPAIFMYLFFTILFGIGYPVLMTGVTQLVFPKQANGSLISVDGKVIGSKLIGQKFQTPTYFWGRPSAIDYNPLPSGGSNSGPTSESLKQAFQERAQMGMAYEMLYASGSGLDPHISPEAARHQVPRVAQARGISQAALKELVREHTQERQFGFLGEPTVNVLELNLALDQMQ